MAHIQINKDKGGSAVQAVINGADYSLDLFRGFELVEVGDDPEYAEVGLRVTFAVSKLDLDTEADVQVTDRFYEVAQRVRSISEGDA